MQLPEKQRHAFYNAVYHNDLKYVRGVLAKSPDIAKTPIMDDGTNDTWLYVAASEGHLEMSALLIKHGADVNAVLQCGTATVHVLEGAVDSDRCDVVDLLLTKGSKPDAERVVIAAIAGEHEHSLELVQLLEKYGADIHREMVNELADKPMNALSTAIAYGRQDVVDYLKSRGAKMPDAKPASPKSPSPKKKRC